MALFVGLSLVPDLDVVPGLLLGDLGGIHNGITNSFVVQLAVSIVLGYAISTAVGGKFSTWSAAAYASLSLHLAMDYFTASRGIMALWPINSMRFTAPVQLFYGFHYSEGLLSPSHLWTALSELLFAATVIGLALYIPRLLRRSTTRALD